MHNTCWPRSLQADTTLMMKPGFAPSITLPDASTPLFPAPQATQLADPGITKWANRKYPGHELVPLPEVSAILRTRKGGIRERALVVSSNAVIQHGPPAPAAAS
ncbi:hypothetical protein NDU88_000624 [Pleurodeles waltl]|uniref:Uncharacterized protein n=1 Tax=Pleurodeles waltl TaxID=8319 RepID=A0AAV7S669_PLEWA|nr:hypothetical protein NDU88_000624 [Pleurodeles waltl]